MQHCRIAIVVILINLVVVVAFVQKKRSISTSSSTIKADSTTISTYNLWYRVGSVFASVGESVVATASTTSTPVKLFRKGVKLSPEASAISRLRFHHRHRNVAQSSTTSLSLFLRPVAFEWSSARRQIHAPTLCPSNDPSRNNPIDRHVQALQAFTHCSNEETETLKEKYISLERTQHLVLVGGGHAHLHVIKAMNRASRPSNLAVTLIDIVDAASYSGMIPGCISGLYKETKETQISLPNLSRWSSINFVQDAVVDIDFAKKLVFTSKASSPICFDVISIDIGSTSRDVYKIPGALVHSIPTRPIHKMLQSIQNRLCHDKEIYSATPQSNSASSLTMTSHRSYNNSGVQYNGGTQPRQTLLPRQTSHLETCIESLCQASLPPPSIVVVGGGVAGIELALSVTSRWKCDVHPKTICTIVHAGDRLLPDLESPASRQLLLEVLNKTDISIMYGTVVLGVNENSIQVVQRSDDTLRMLPYTHCLWATGAGPHRLPLELMKHRGLSCSDTGWIKVTDTLQSVSYPFVFAAGDCASLITAPQTPKSGVYAVRAGPILRENIAKYLDYLKKNTKNESQKLRQKDNTAYATTTETRAHQQRKMGGYEKNDDNYLQVESSIVFNEVKEPTQEQQQLSNFLTKYIPQDDFMKLVVCGNGKAIGFRYGIAFYGKWVLSMKDHIDRNFIELYNVNNLGPPPTPLHQDDQTSQIVNTRQYDADIEKDLSFIDLDPTGAAKLLQRSDDNVDYQQAWYTLRRMSRDEAYRKAVIENLVMSVVDGKKYGDHGMRYKSNVSPMKIQQV